MRVSEIYSSVQGEGPRVGQTTVFLRFGGCNLRCPGWPCDTQHAIDPAYRNEWHVWDAQDLAEKVHETAYKVGAKLITFTGGEPFLQPKPAMKELAARLLGHDPTYHLEAFTNGTLLYPDWALDLVSMIVDWKLPGSGESHTLPQRIDNLQKLSAANNGIVQHAVKFVILDWQDFATAVELYEQYEDLNLLWYYGRVWDTDLTDAQLVDAVMTEGLPWRLNVQLHNHIWPAHERGR